MFNGNYIDVLLDDAEQVAQCLLLIRMKLKFLEELKCQGWWSFRDSINFKQRDLASCNSEEDLDTAENYIHYLKKEILISFPHLRNMRDCYLRLLDKVDFIIGGFKAPSEKLQKPGENSPVEKLVDLMTEGYASEPNGGLFDSGKPADQDHLVQEEAQWKLSYAHKLVKVSSSGSPDKAVHQTEAGRLFATPNKLRADSNCSEAVRKSIQSVTLSEGTDQNEPKTSKYLRVSGQSMQKEGEVEDIEDKNQEGSQVIGNYFPLTTTCSPPMNTEIPETPEEEKINRTYCIKYIDGTRKRVEEIENQSHFVKLQEPVLSRQNMNYQISEELHPGPTKTLRTRTKKRKNQECSEVVSASSATINLENPPDKLLSIKNTDSQRKMRGIPKTRKKRNSSGKAMKTKEQESGSNEKMDTNSQEFNGRITRARTKRKIPPDFKS